MRAHLALAVLISCNAGFLPGFAAAQQPHAFIQALALDSPQGPPRAEHRFLPHQYFPVFRPAS